MLDRADRKINYAHVRQSGAPKLEDPGWQDAKGRPCLRTSGKTTGVPRTRSFAQFTPRLLSHLTARKPPKSLNWAKGKQNQFQE